MVYCRPTEEGNKKQELVGKIIDLIKREQIKLNLIEDQKLEKEIRHKSVETTTISSLGTMLDDVNALFEKNTVSEVEEALNVVTEAMKAEPVFSKQIEDNELSETTIATTPAPSIEDMVVNVYTALPKEVQETIKTGYETVVER